MAKQVDNTGAHDGEKVAVEEPTGVEVASDGGKAAIDDEKKHDIAEPAGRRKSNALNIVENPLTVSLPSPHEPLTPNHTLSSYRT